MEKKNVPKIRFPGFTEPWEQRKLGDYLIQYTEVTTKNNQYPVLTSSRKGIFFQKDYYDGNQIASQDNTGYNIVPFGYFTYRHMSDDEIFRFNINDIVENGIVSTLYPVFTTNDKLDSKYLQYQLNYGREFKRYAILQKQGGSRTYMYFNKLKELILTLPPSVEEQEKISNFFSKLDNLISLHHRKLENLKKQKKGLLQKMFPEKGKKVPEIRFPEFTNDWEQRKLGDECQIIMGQSPDSTTYSDMPQEYILVQGNADLKDGWVSPRIWTTQKTKTAQAGDLIMSVRAPAGAMGKTAYDVVIGRGVASINGNEFIYQLLVKMYEEGYWKKLSCGSTFESLNTENIFNAKIPIPYIEEQKTIGSFFLKLDKLISLHQRKLEHLQKQKKALLQQMFV